MNRNRPGFGTDSAVKNAVRRRDGDECRYCGYPAECIDHIEPYSYRRNNSLSNLVAACNRCNAIAASHYFEDFETKRDWILLRRRPEMLRQLRTWALNFEDELGAASASLADFDPPPLAAARRRRTVLVGWFSLPRWRTAHQVEQIGARDHVRLWATTCGRAYQSEDPVVDDSPVRAPADMKRCEQCVSEFEAEFSESEVNADV